MPENSLNQAVKSVFEARKHFANFFRQTIPEQPSHIRWEY